MKTLIFLLVTLWSASVFASNTTAPDVYIFPAELERVVDGDTMDVRVVMPLGLRWDLRLRILEIDTPETWRPSTLSEKLHGEAATAHAIELLDQGPFWVRINDWGVYNRAEADIILHDLSDYAETMKAAGFEKREHYEDRVP